MQMKAEELRGLESNSSSSSRRVSATKVCMPMFPNELAHKNGGGGIVEKNKMKP